MDQSERHFLITHNNAIYGNTRSVAYFGPDVEFLRISSVKSEFFEEFVVKI